MRDSSPRSGTREGRVALLVEVADALLQGRFPDSEAALFVGAVFDAWLRTGGAFEKHARVGAPRGSHHKHNVLYQRLIADERRAAPGGARIRRYYCSDEEPES